MIRRLWPDRRGNLRGDGNLLKRAMVENYNWGWGRGRFRSGISNTEEKKYVPTKFTLDSISHRWINFLLGITLGEKIISASGQFFRAKKRDFIHLFGADAILFFFFFSLEIEDQIENNIIHRGRKRELTINNNGRDAKLVSFSKRE